MSKPLAIHIKESLSELRSLQRKSSYLISKRLAVLIAIKQHEKAGGISKRDLSAKTGVNHNSIIKWRKMYLSGGLEKLLHHGRIGFKPSLISKAEHAQLEAKLKDPQNNLQGYIALLHWTKTTWNRAINYTTLYE
jgi:transposase